MKTRLLFLVSICSIFMALVKTTPLFWAAFFIYCIKNSFCKKAERGDFSECRELVENRAYYVQSMTGIFNEKDTTLFSEIHVV